MTQPYFAGSSPPERYGQVLNCVESNTTFYATPSHDQLLAGPRAEVQAFLDTIAPLEDVLGPFLLQLPARSGPSIRATCGDLSTPCPRR